MKILKLNLKAFGPFTDQELDLSGGDEGFHLIYGDNEAGKSSALRALTYLFYGFPGQTTDNFLHNNTKLRIGAEVRHSDGETFEFLRRKGNKETLLGPAGNALPDTALGRFLAGVDERRFGSFYGIDHRELVQGGKDILQAGGDVGRSLFDAGLGGNSLRKVIQALDDESGAIFKTQGKQTLDRLIDEFKSVRKTAKELSQTSRVWTDHDRALKEAREAKEVVVEELGELSNEMKRIERIERALPKIAALQDIEEKLKELDAVVLLPETFTEERRETQRMLEQASSERDKSRAALDQIQEDIKALNVPEELLRVEQAIHEIYERRGGHVKAAGDIPSLRSKMEQSRALAKEILKTLRPGLELEEAESLRLTESQRARIQELGSQFESLGAELRNSGERVAELEEEVKRQKEQLADLPDTPDTQKIELTIKQARREPNLEDQLSNKKEERRKLEAQSRIDLKKLGLWEGALEDLEALAVTSPETIDRFDGDFSNLANERSNLVRDLDLAKRQVEEIERDLAKVQSEGAVPTEADLKQARIERDEGWRLVRRAWLDGERDPERGKVFDPDRELPEAYEQSVRKADDVADLIRREADKVARVNELTSRRELLHQSIEKGSSEKWEGLEGDSVALHEAWCKEWSFLNGDPHLPKEMRAWRAKQEVLAQQAQRIREIGEEVEGLKKLADEHSSNLRGCLKAFGRPAAGDVSLRDLIDQCEEVADAIAKIREQRRELEESINDREIKRGKAAKKQNQAQQKLDEWRAAWNAEVERIGLTEKDTPTQANAVLNKIQELFVALKEAEDYRSRIDTMEKDAKQFEKDVKALAGQAAPDLAKLPAEQAAAQLNSSLNQARENKASLRELKGQEEKEEGDLSEADRIIREKGRRIEELCKEADCSEAELEEIEERSARKRKLSDSRGESEARILEIGEGLSIDEMKEEVASVDAGDLPAQKLRLSEKIQELEGKRDEWNQQIGREETELKKMDGSAEAAEAEQQAQGVLARIQDEAERFARLRLAHTILKQEIERYREQNQGPVLKRASELFKLLTLGSFSSLQADYDDQDNAVLIGVRGPEEKVTVDGMSDGTLDQLYLSLRLASLEHNLEANEPIPFIVDDVLINFDDSRAASALGALAAVSLKTQVLCFTHHRRLVELAQAALDGSVLYLHTLER